jgi:hypothetical protein
MEASAGGWTVSWQDAFADPEVAVIEVTPADFEVANPLELTAATFGSEVAQVTVLVTSCVLWSE